MHDSCRECGGEEITFEVPDTLREHAPEGGSRASICANCLRVRSVDDAESADAGTATQPAFERIDTAFPTGDGGVAFALLIGTLPSVTLDKESAVALREYAERRGVDVHLTLDRLAGAADAGALDPSFAFTRRLRQFESLVG